MESNIGSEDRKTQNDSHLILRLEHEDVIGTVKEERWNLQNSFFTFRAMKKPFSEHLETQTLVKSLVFLLGDRRPHCCWKSLSAFAGL